jgi:hypothetical protein
MHSNGAPTRPDTWLSIAVFVPAAGFKPLFENLFMNIRAESRDCPGSGIKTAYRCIQQCTPIGPRKQSIFSFAKNPEDGLWVIGQRFHRGEIPRKPPRRHFPVLGMAGFVGRPYFGRECAGAGASRETNLSSRDSRFFGSQALVFLLPVICAIIHREDFGPSAGTVGGVPEHRREYCNENIARRG